MNSSDPPVPPVAQPLAHPQMPVVATDLIPWPTRPTHFQKTPQNKGEVLGGVE